MKAACIAPAKPWMTRIAGIPAQAPSRQRGSGAAVRLAVVIDANATPGRGPLDAIPSGRRSPAARRDRGPSPAPITPPKG
ncbi:hypothetical protein JCM2811A_02680 [Methylorubrum rhodinum]